MEVKGNHWHYHLSRLAAALSDPSFSLSCSPSVQPSVFFSKKQQRTKE